MIALARKYRPRRFADLVVQDHVAAALRGAVARGRVGHGYLLTGPRGVGKTTAARILAMALNCERQSRESPTGEPCGECPTCQRVWSGSANLDVVEIDAASNRSVEDARDLRERAMYAASTEQHYKVYIIDEAHMLTREAWNALLKILEEPPPRVVFVFATTEPQKIANTAAPVLSRLQRFDFRRIGASAIAQRIAEVLDAEKIAADPDAIALIARYADGGMRDALSVLDQCLTLSEGKLTVEGVRLALGLIADEVYAAVFEAIARQDAGAVFPVIDQLVGAGADLVEFANGLAELLRGAMKVTTGAPVEGLTTAQKELVTAVAGRLSTGDLLRMLSILAQAEFSIRRGANPRLVVETTLLKWTLMDRTISLEAALQGGGPETPSRNPNPGRDPSAPTARGPAPSPERRDNSFSNPREKPAAPSPDPKRPIKDLSDLKERWPEVVTEARSRSQLLGTVVEHLEPADWTGNKIVLKPQDLGATAFLDGAKTKQGQLAEVFGHLVGSPIEVGLVLTPQIISPDKPKRMSINDLAASRLREIRAKDPSLDAAADALDLEIIE